jgi:hypothetical protein
LAIVRAKWRTSPEFKATSAECLGFNQSECREVGIKISHFINYSAMALQHGVSLGDCKVQADIPECGNDQIFVQLEPMIYFVIYILQFYAFGW